MNRSNTGIQVSIHVLVLGLAHDGEGKPVLEGNDLKFADTGVAQENLGHNSPKGSTVDPYDVPCPSLPSLYLCAVPPRPSLRVT
ncbi:MAG: hypothetical protein L6365_21475 [Desulfobulbaceae bacterium]|nr:hypothetical protein [Pseudomonadota bacterium]MCG2750091.1 hypothetical protein [Desulfobulbaceae bacterium]